MIFIASSLTVMLWANVWIRLLFLFHEKHTNLLSFLINLHPAVEYHRFNSMRNMISQILFYIKSTQRKSIFIHRIEDLCDTILVLSITRSTTTKLEKIIQIYVDNHAQCRFCFPFLKPQEFIFISINDW